MIDRNLPVLTNIRSGKSGDEYVKKDETLVVVNSQVILSEIPDFYQRVVVTGQNKQWHEIDKGIPADNQYKVDYRNKIVTFNQSNNNKQLNFSYMGRGNMYFPTSMIYTQEKNGEIVQTLKDLTDTTDTARLESIKATKDTKLATETATLQANYAKEQGDVAKQEASNLSKMKSDVVAATNTANANEETRKSNETARGVNEDARKTNETKRLTAESTRYVAELERQDNEDERIANEEKRQSTFTSKMNEVTSKGDYAKKQGEFAKTVAEENKTRWLPPVQDFEELLRKYPNPQLGDQVALISNGMEYRFTTEWEVTRIPSSSAITDMQRQILEMKDEMSIIDAGTFGTAPSSYAIDGGTF